MKHDHVISQIRNPQLTNDNVLWVIGVISNVQRFDSRYRLFRKWYQEMVETPCVKVIVVEAAFKDRNFEVTDPTNPLHVRLHIDQEIWHKESMINIGQRLVPLDAKYICWCDADIFFPDKGWAQETLHQLQHYNVVQPWQNCLDLGVHGSVMTTFQSWAFMTSLGKPIQWHPKQPYPYAHSGFCWAATRYFWENTKGLLDFAILGSADHHMAAAMIGKVDWSISPKMGDGFKRQCREWQRKVFPVVNGHIGYVKTRIEHHFHGPKAARRYRERWQILEENSFDPEKDISHDTQGLIRLNGKPKLLYDCHEYFAHRNEDSIEEY